MIRLLKDALLLGYEVLISLWLPNMIRIVGCIFCCAILANLGMGTGEEDEPLENVLPADAAERAATWLS